MALKGLNCPGSWTRDAVFVSLPCTAAERAVSEVHKVLRTAAERAVSEVHKMLRTAAERAVSEVHKVLRTAAERAVSQVHKVLRTAAERAVSEVHKVLRTAAERAVSQVHKLLRTAAVRAVSQVHKLLRTARSPPPEHRSSGGGCMTVSKLQALVYDIRPSTTAVCSNATGFRKLSVNEQFFVGA